MSQGKGGIKVYGLVKIGQGIVKLPSGCLQAAAADVALRFKAVYLDGVIVVGESLCGISKEKV